MSIPHRISDKTITVVLDGKVHTVQRSAMNADALLKELLKPSPDPDEVRAYINVQSYIITTVGRVSIDKDTVLFDGNVINSYMTQRIIRHQQEGVNVRPLLTFLELVMTHPLPNMAQDLFKWCETGDMPFTAEGHVIAYKKVNEHYRSYHASPDGTHLFHPIGGRVDMPAEQVNTSRTTTCSTGLHFCAYSYLSHYNGDKGRVLMVSIHPHHILAIPNDYNNAKGRASGYNVIGELPTQEANNFFTRKLVVDEYQTYKAAPETLKKNAEPVVKKPAKATKKKAKAKAKKTSQKGPKNPNRVQSVPAVAPKVDAIVFEDKLLDEYQITHKALKLPVSYREVQAKVKELGQTKAGAHYGVARTTIQEWLKKIAKLINGE